MARMSYTSNPESIRRELEQEYSDGIPEQCERVLLEWTNVRNSPNATLEELQAIVSKAQREIEPLLRPNIRWDAEVGPRARP